MSIRLGFYTGKLYDDSYDKSNIQECCLVLHPGHEQDEIYISEERERLKVACKSCQGLAGCKEYRKGE